MAAAAALRTARGSLRHVLSLAHRNVPRDPCVAQLVSRFSTFNLRHIKPPAVSTIANLTSPLRNNLICGHESFVLKSGSPPIPRFQQSVRTLTYFGLRRGKRKTVKAVVKRFLRLHCGLWVRRKAGYKKKLWKKSADRKRRLRQHVFCNRTQSKLLDKMTTDFWKRRNWYVNDPYQMYHDRTNLKV
ncbi:39S ribosomal protein L35, mitochondrial [Callorhinchus milii]|uniref:Large ribosomal subunit protein bL35m n=1 Tax=Callorhinchus milii TaxID=7868 RepID=K4FTG8_CALMI|nr:39S ribosomal protein L35, mitochondrial [Callorhinchus milii]AFK10649.1 mitochondrial ribosomal protein L35 [Callorhinchus milii]